jgi:flagellar capping protein FliD
LYNKLDAYIGSDGYISSTITSFDKNVQYYDDRVTSAQKRLDSGAEVLRNKYEQLQAQLATLLDTQTFITSLFG